MSDTFAAYLRAHLTAAGINAKTLAIRVGVGEATVNHWLIGQRVPRPVTADKISTTLQIDANRTRRAAGHPVLNIALTDQGALKLTDTSTDELLGEIRRRLTTTSSTDDATLPTADRVNAIATATRELLADLPADTPIGTHLAAALAELEAAALHENTPTRTEDR